MSGRRHHSITSGPRYHILGVPHHAGVVDDDGPGFFGEERLGQQTHDIFPRHKAAVLVKQETAVEIAIPRDAEIGTRRHHRLRRHRLVFRQQRVGDAIGKTAIGGMV